MREIKFRVFCTYRKTMIKVGVDNNASFNSDGTISTHGVLGENPLLQFTGLKDKNGVEIYEGDILENKKSAKGNYFIKFNCGGYDAVYKNNFTLCLHPVLSEFDGAEVIGNIYEHPHLLTEH